MGNVFDYLRYVPGGGLYRLEPPTPDGTRTNLTEDFSAVDISGFDISYDARQIVVSMRHSEDDRYHIWIANADGTGWRQITDGPSHDVQPVFLPGDRIAFLSNEPYTAMGTRADEYNHSRIVAQIGTIGINGDNRYMCGQGLSHRATLTGVLADGRLVFSSWEHLTNRNDLKVFAMNPDCTNVMAVAGEFGKYWNSLTQAVELEPGVFVGIASSREDTFQGGALMRFDARSRTSIADPGRLDVQQVVFENLTPQVPTGMESPPSGVGRYRSPHSLPGTDQILVSWADGDVNGRNELAGTAPNWGVYLFNPETRERTLIYDNPTAWDLYAQPLIVTEVPPIRGAVVDGTYDTDTPSVLGSVDLTSTSMDETVSGARLDGQSLTQALGSATRVRIIEGFSSEIGPVREFGLTMAEGAAIVGEALVYDDASWEAAVPPYLPYHLQPLDEYGLSIRNQNLWIQAMPGEERRCGGCHADRSQNILPRSGPTTIAQQVGAEDFNIPIPDRTEISWIDSVSGRTVQDVFNENCVSCHDGGAMDPYAGRSYQVNVTTEDGMMLTYDVPYLLLTAAPMEIYYEMEIVQYPASYVTLLYPGSMMGDVTATGDVPPEWVQIHSARTSRLVEVVNSQSELDGSWAWDSASHPEDVGITLTQEDRLMLIRMADLGGQFYTRQNIEGAARWGAEDY